MWRVRSPYKLTIEEALLFLYGFLGTMPILEFGGYTFFVYLTFLVIGWNLLLILQRKGWSFTLQPICYPLILITICNIVSAIGCLISDMPEIWKNAQVSQILLAILYLLFFFFYAEPKRRPALKYYIRGVYAASIFQMFWGYAQFLYQRNSEISLNEMVLSHILKLEVTVNSDWRTTVTGLCRHNSNFAPLLTFGFAMSKSIWLKLLFALMVVLCGNRTALIGLVVCAFCQLILYLKDREETVGIWRFGGRTAQISLLAGLLICVAVVLSGFGTQLLDQASVVVQKIISIFNGSNGSFRAHLRYWTSVPQVIQWADLWNVLFGFGIVCSGYPMNVLFGAYPGIQWVIECDYINVLWSNGLIGLILLYGWYFRQMYQAAKTDKRYMTFFIPLLVMGVTYNVLYNWCVILLYCIFLLVDSKVSFRDLILMEEHSDESHFI